MFFPLTPLKCKLLYLLASITVCTAASLSPIQLYDFNKDEFHF